MGRINSSTPHGVTFHYFHGGPHRPGQGSISAEQFRNMLLYLSRSQNLISAHEWAEKAIASSLDESDVCLSFDDNLKCQFEIAKPVLDEMKIKAFFFVNTSVLLGEYAQVEVYRHFRQSYFKSLDDFYDAFFDAAFKSKYARPVAGVLNKFDHSKYLRNYDFYSPRDKAFRFVRDWVLGTSAYNELMEELILQKGFKIEQEAGNLWMSEKDLKNLDQEGHVVGMHSHTHPTAMATLDKRVQKEEYVTNFNTLKDVLGKRPLTMSHPCSSYNEHTLDILKGLGISLGFNANLTQIESNSMLEMPRDDQSHILMRMASK